MTYPPHKSPSANATESGAGGKFSAPTNEFRAAGFLLGFGLGGFIDAIVLHMLLQWHHLISSRVSMDTLAGLQVNVLADGAFSAGMWLITVVGIGVLWRSAQKTPTVPLTTSGFVGWILMGWGGFQLFDSIFFHALLGLHHIRHVPNFMVYDIAFFLLGFGLIWVGYLMMRNQANS